LLRACGAVPTLQKEKQSSWQSFLKGKGTKKKAGFFTGHKKDSMFSVNEGGKVGVVGSGKGMTDYKKRQRHEFDLDSAE
jgi:survival of motor neuron-related-splicing factor 30